MDFFVCYTFAVLVFAAYVQSVTGFGFIIVATPFLLLFLDAKAVVALMVVTATLNNLPMLWQTRHDGGNRLVLEIFLGSLFGLVPGAYLLKIIDQDLLKTAIGIAILLVVCVMSRDIRFHVRRPHLVRGIASVIAGFMGGTTGMNGPALLVCFLNERMEKTLMRATLVRYFFLSNIITISLMLYLGTLTERILLDGLVYFPAVLLGAWLGEKTFRRISQTVFHKISLWLLFLSGLSCILGQWLK